MYSEGDLPLSSLGAGDVFVDYVVAPISQEAGELVVDFVDADEGAPDAGGRQFGYVLGEGY